MVRHALRIRFGTALIPILAGMICASASLLGQTHDLASDLDVFVQQKQYVELEHAFVGTASQLPPLSRTYFQGVMANRTNHVHTSVLLLEPVIPSLLVISPLRAEIALCTLADDYAKSFRYAKAARVYAEAYRLAEQQEKNSECHAAKEASRWGLLSNAPRQTVATTGAFTIPGKRDSLGLFQVPVTSGNYSGSWIVDSGANLSVVSRSVANKLGLETSTGSETAQGITGLFVAVRTAVIPEVRLGPALLRNIAVLVVEDSDLSFSRLDYRIEGCLGLPVLAALGKVTFYRDGRVAFSPQKVPAKRKSSHNFFLDRFTPLIVADFGGGKQLFTLDTGSMETILSAQFYKENRDIINVGEQVGLELSGAGGTLMFPAQQISILTMKLGGACTRIKDISVLTGATRLPDQFYGNVGQSSLGSFSSFTLDFHAMDFRVNGGNSGDCTNRLSLVPSDRVGNSIIPAHSSAQND